MRAIKLEATAIVLVRLEHCKAKHQGPGGPTSAVCKPRSGRAHVCVVCVCALTRESGGGGSRCRTPPEAEIPKLLKTKLFPRELKLKLCAKTKFEDENRP